MTPPIRLSLVSYGLGQRVLEITRDQKSKSQPPADQIARAALQGLESLAPRLARLDSRDLEGRARLIQETLPSIVREKLGLEETLRVDVMRGSVAPQEEEGLLTAQDAQKEALSWAREQLNASALLPAKDAAGYARAWTESLLKAMTHLKPGPERALRLKALAIQYRDGLPPTEPVPPILRDLGNLETAGSEIRQEALRPSRASPSQARHAILDPSVVWAARRSSECGELHLVDLDRVCSRLGCSNQEALRWIALCLDTLQKHPVLSEHYSTSRQLKQLLADCAQPEVRDGLLRQAKEALSQSGGYPDRLRSALQTVWEGFPADADGSELNWRLQELSRHATQLQQDWAGLPRDLPKAPADPLRSLQQMERALTAAQEHVDRWEQLLQRLDVASHALERGDPLDLDLSALNLLPKELGPDALEKGLQELLHRLQRTQESLRTLQAVPASQRAERSGWARVLLALFSLGLSLLIAKISFGLAYRRERTRLELLLQQDMDLARDAVSRLASVIGTWQAELAQPSLDRPRLLRAAQQIKQLSSELQAVALSAAAEEPLDVDALEYQLLLCATEQGASIPAALQQRASLVPHEPRMAAYRTWRQELKRAAAGPMRELALQCMHGSAPSIAEVNTITHQLLDAALDPSQPARSARLLNQLWQDLNAVSRKIDAALDEPTLQTARNRLALVRIQLLERLFGLKQLEREALLAAAPAQLAWIRHLPELDAEDARSKSAHWLSIIRILSEQGLSEALAIELQLANAPIEKGLIGARLQVGVGELQLADEPLTSQFVKQAAQADALEAKALQALSDERFGLRSRDLFRQGALECMTDEAQVRAWIKEHLDDPIFSHANFVRTESVPFDASHADLQRFAAVFRKPDGTEQIILSDRDPSRGEFRSSILRDALARPGYASLRELIERDHLTPRDQTLRYALTPLKFEVIPTDTAEECQQQLNQLQPLLKNRRVGNATLEELFVSEPPSVPRIEDPERFYRWLRGVREPVHAGSSQQELQALMRDALIGDEDASAMPKLNEWVALIFQGKDLADFLDPQEKLNQVANQARRAFAQALTQVMTELIHNDSPEVLAAANARLAQLEAIVQTKEGARDFWLKSYDDALKGLETALFQELPQADAVARYAERLSAYYQRQDQWFKDAARGDVRLERRLRGLGITSLKDRLHLDVERRPELLKNLSSEAIAQKNWILLAALLEYARTLPPEQKENALKRIAKPFGDLLRTDLQSPAEPSRWITSLDEVQSFLQEFTDPAAASSPTNLSALVEHIIDLTLGELSQEEWTSMTAWKEAQLEHAGHDLAHWKQQIREAAAPALAAAAVTDENRLEGLKGLKGALRELIKQEKRQLVRLNTLEQVAQALPDSPVKRDLLDSWAQRRQDEIEALQMVLQEFGRLEAVLADPTSPPETLAQAFRDVWSSDAFQSRLLRGMLPSLVYAGELALLAKNHPVPFQQRVSDLASAAFDQNPFGDFLEPTPDFSIDQLRNQNLQQLSSPGFQRAPQTLPNLKEIQDGMRKATGQNDPGIALIQEQLKSLTAAGNRLSSLFGRILNAQALRS